MTEYIPLLLSRWVGLSEAQKNKIWALLCLFQKMFLTHLHLGRQKILVELLLSRLTIKLSKTGELRGKEASKYHSVQYELLKYPRLPEHLYIALSLI